MSLTITAANAIFALAIPGLYDIPQILQGYSADAAFETAQASPAEVQMGVDGHMSSGFVPFTTEQTIMLQANSPSIAVFEQWLQAQKTLRENLPANAIITISSIGKRYSCFNGVLTGIIQIPSARKVLQPPSYTITWNDVSPSPI